MGKGFQIKNAGKIAFDQLICPRLAKIASSVWLLSRWRGCSVSGRRPYSGPGGWRTLPPGCGTSSGKRQEAVNLGFGKWPIQSPCCEISLEGAKGGHTWLTPSPRLKNLMRWEGRVHIHSGNCIYSGVQWFETKDHSCIFGYGVGSQDQQIQKYVVCYFQLSYFEFCISFREKIKKFLTRANLF